MGVSSRAIGCSDGGVALYFFDAVDDMGQELGWSLSSL
ncbi:hypothetical protein XOCgx_4275 [Xanthomonas oryzae pv. oryzicola]|nr:hypothetical protein XOCgx_4275 [Xanthomonas oryzae pv. oryzicola]